MGRLIGYGVLCLLTNLIMFPGKGCSPFAALLCTGQYESLITLLIAGTHWQDPSLEKKIKSFHLSGTLSADSCGCAHILHSAGWVFWNTCGHGVSCLKCTSGKGFCIMFSVLKEFLWVKYNLSSVDSICGMMSVAARRYYQLVPQFLKTEKMCVLYYSCSGSSAGNRPEPKSIKICYCLGLCN